MCSGRAVEEASVIEARVGDIAQEKLRVRLEHRGVVVSLLLSVTQLGPHLPQAAEPESRERPPEIQLRCHHSIPGRVVLEFELVNREGVEIFVYRIRPDVVGIDEVLGDVWVEFHVILSKRGIQPVGLVLASIRIGYLVIQLKKAFE